MPHGRRPPLSGNKTPNQNATRRDRRATERQERFESARDQRRARGGAGGGGGGSSWLNTTTILVGAVVVGVLIVVFVAIGQLGGKATGTFNDPGIAYPASLLDQRSIGKADAPVTLEVWEDFQCPVCAKHSLTVEPVLVEQYVKTGVLRIVHRDLAFLGRGGADDESKLAASGAVCATAQGKYWTYSHWVYNNQDGENNGGFRRERLKQIAQAAGVDVTSWDTCINDPATVKEVADSTTTGVGQGINSTPTMYINGTQVQPAGLKTAAELGALIEAAAAVTPSPAPSASAAP
ncbi:MAG: thioredoxin domain-containing protein [Candidatus Limnocylindrales bacterium]